MSRVAMLRAGYGAFGVAFLSLAGAQLAGNLVLLALLAGLAGGLCLALSKDDLPKWAGLAMLAYFALSLLAFLAATPITIGRGGGYFVNDKPSAVFDALYYYVVLAFPIMLGATALASTWERELPPRALLMGAVAGSALWAVLSYALVPRVDPSLGVGAATAQNNLLALLAAASALAGAAGAAWAASRPDEYA